MLVLSLLGRGGGGKSVLLKDFDRFFTLVPVGAAGANLGVGGVEVGVEGFVTIRVCDVCF